MSQLTSNEVAMPRLSDSMEEGTVLSWLKRVGDQVAVGEELVEIETDKANMVYEADVAGTLLEILAKEGESHPVGTPIARVGDSGAEAAVTQPAAPDSAGMPSGSGAVAKVKASPVARRLAAALGVELASVVGSGPGGRVVRSDVEKAAEGGAVAPSRGAGASAPDEGAAQVLSGKGEVEVRDLTRLQATVARRMSESKSTAPHFYLTAEVDMSAAVAARTALKAGGLAGDGAPSFNDMAVKAAALALTDFPKANGAYKDGRWELYSRINIGIAVAARESLIVPTIFDADRKGLRRIAEESRALATRVRDGSITPPELSAGTFTVSNLGMYGIESFGAVINGGQAAILAVGAIREAPVVQGGKLVPGKLMKLTLVGDHRILNGAEAAEFLDAVRGYLQQPVALAL
jgi:pyruvate dehydrogenase E2 component (dihydrolipoamide acetyltransferase)